MAPIILDIKRLNEHLKDDPFLGKGTMTISEIFFSSPSRCAVADGCHISIDRRLTVGETHLSALEEIRALPSVKEVGAIVEMYDYSRPSYTGLVYPTESYFPTWVIPQNHPACVAAIDSYKGLFKQNPVVDKWTFSTNGVTIMGRYGIPCVGFGPGDEKEAHAPNEKTRKSDLVTCAALYAALPLQYVQHQSKGEK
jgi:putative selenium metabolism hydrolase